MSDKEQSLFTQRLILFAAVWTLGAATLFIWNGHILRTHAKQSLETQARAVIERDLAAIQNWADGHDKGYVQPTDSTQSDAVSRHRRSAPLMNPIPIARMTRERSSPKNGSRGRPSSLHPLRAENAPDAWERSALERFSQGETEVSSSELVEGEPFMRLMLPLRTEKSCLRCHATHGYKEGDILGGISIALPFRDILALQKDQLLHLAGAFLCVWTCGLALMVFISIRLRKADAVLRESEWKFRTLLNFTNDWEYWISPKGEALYVSPSCENITGYSPAEFLGDPTLLQKLIHPEDRQAYKQHVSEVFTGPQAASQELEFRILRRDGELCWLSHACRPIYDETGAPLGRRISNRDITHRKKISESLQKTLVIKETLLREVHHRVKNNLQTIIHLARLRSESLDDEVARRSLREFEDQARSMAAVYEQLFNSADFSHVDMQRYLQTLAAGILHGFRTRDGVLLSTEADGVLLDVAQAMPCGLIINELITNALKHAFTPEHLKAGKGHIRVAMRTESGGRVLLTVEDDGKSLPEGLDPARTDSMGLKLVRLWAEHQLGGTFSIETGPPKSFRVSFPVSKTV